MTKYEVIIHWSEEDKAFILKCLNLQAVWPTEKHTKSHWQMAKLSFRNGLRLPKN